MHWCFNCQKSVNVDTQITIFNETEHTTLKCVTCSAVLSVSTNRAVALNKTNKKLPKK